jgi:hypothetical protein
MKNLFFLFALLALFSPRVFSEPIEESFFMIQYEDGKEMKDIFEIWTVKADLGEKQKDIKIQVVSFVNDAGETHAFQWLHDSNTVSLIAPQTYKAEFNGRLGFPLEVIFELNSDSKNFKTVTGSTRIGARGQSIAIFKPDTKTTTRKVELVNPFSFKTTKDK